jgi:hypothetical protein
MLLNTNTYVYIYVYIYVYTNIYIYVYIYINLDTDIDRPIQSSDRCFLFSFPVFKSDANLSTVSFLSALLTPVQIPAMHFAIFPTLCLAVVPADLAYKAVSRS